MDSLGFTLEPNTALYINYNPIKKKKKAHQSILRTLCHVRTQWEKSEPGSRPSPVTKLLLL